MNTSISNIKYNHYYNSSGDNGILPHISNYKLVSENNSRAIGTINSYKTLKNNWDGYGALSPSDKTITKTVTFILKLSEYDVEVFFVAPTPDGDILVETKFENAALEFELASDSEDTITATQNNEFVSEAVLNDTTFINYMRWLICPDGRCPSNL